MPLNSSQLAALVERARQKAPPVVTPLPAPSRKLSDNPPKPVEQPTQPTPATPPPRRRPETPPPQLDKPIERPHLLAAATTSDDFPTGWHLQQNSWRFHRRFYAVFRRPMHRGEYSYLLHQIRFGHAEHLGEDCWRVTLPDRRTTLPVRASKWTLITILPKNWQPPPPG